MEILILQTAKKSPSSALKNPSITSFLKLLPGAVMPMTVLMMALFSLLHCRLEVTFIFSPGFKPRFTSLLAVAYLARGRSHGMSWGLPPARWMGSFSWEIRLKMDDDLGGPPLMETPPHRENSFQSTQGLILLHRSQHKRHF